MDREDIEKAAKEQGWLVGRNKKGHPEFTSPDGSIVIVGSGTPSDWRSNHNLLADLKRAGLKWPWTARDRRRERKEARKRQEEQA
jgi:predicted RNA binding protein YcfA (HicA-like mRNA interferase family)